MSLRTDADDNIRGSHILSFSPQYGPEEIDPPFLDIAHLIPAKKIEITSLGARRGGIAGLGGNNYNGTRREEW